MFVFLCLICAVLVVLIAWLVSHTIWLNSYVGHLPRVSLRLLTPLLSLNTTPVEIFRCIEKIVNAYEGLATLWLGPRLVVICDDAEDVKTIFSSKSCLNKPYLYRMISGTGRGIFTANDEMWRSDRKNINTVFTLGILKTFAPIFNRQFANMSKSLEKYVDQPEFDLTKHVFEYNLNVVCETILRSDYELTTKSSSAKAVEYIARLWRISTNRACSIILHPYFIYRLSSLHAEEKEIADHLFAVGPKIVEYNSEKRKISVGNCKPMVLIDRLLDLEGKGLMDRQRLLDQINTFIVAGTDTNSFASLNVLLLLAMNQDAQNRLFEEIRSSVDNPDYIDYDTLSKLDYLDRVVKESQRLLPVTQIMLRETDNEVQLTKCVAPKGAVLVVCSLKIHRSKKYWGPTADEFDPDRFLPESMDKVHPFAFFPFAAGARNCIGYKHALNSIKFLLCHVLLNHKLTTSMRMSDIVFKNEFLLKLDNKYMIKLERRSSN